MAQTGLARTLFVRLLIVGLLGLAILVLLVRQGLVAVPDEMNPFVPLNVRDEPNWLTGYKLGRIERNAPECLAALAGSPVAFTPIPDQVTGEGCGFTNAVDVERSSVAFNSRFPATCPLAAGRCSSCTSCSLRLVGIWAGRSAGSSISAPMPAATSTIGIPGGAASTRQPMPSTLRDSGSLTARGSVSWPIGIARRPGPPFSGL
jgi:hypothetical protein